MMDRFKPFLFTGILLLAGLFSCSRGGLNVKESLQGLRGTDLNGARVDFSSIPSKRFVLNFYSPTCQPCIEELPALSLLFRELQAKGIPLYMVVEGRPDSHGLMPVADSNVSQIYEVIRTRLLKDVNRYGIEIPIVILDPAMKMSSQNGLITGTPETLIFESSPLKLEYNFLGPISTGETEEEIRGDTRFQFALQKALGGEV